MITFQPMQSVLEAIHEYYNVFSTLDLSAIASCYCEPCMSISPQGVFSAANRAIFVEPQVTMLTETAALVRGVALRYAAAGQKWNGSRLVI